MASGFDIEEAKLAIAELLHHLYGVLHAIRRIAAAARRELDEQASHRQFTRPTWHAVVAHIDESTGIQLRAQDFTDLRARLRVDPAIHPMQHDESNPGRSSARSCPNDAS